MLVLRACSLAVRDETIKSALLTEAAVQTHVKMLSSVAVAASDVDEIVHEMLLPCDDEVVAVTKPALD